MSVAGRDRLVALGQRAVRAARVSPDLVRAAALVADPLGLVRGELAELPVVLPYRLRRSAVRVYVRHTRGDLRELGVAVQQARAIAPALRGLRDGPPLRVVDAGAGLGYFPLWLLAVEAVASIVSFEPDPIRAVILRRSLRANGLEDAWRIVEAAPAARAGTAQLSIDSVGTEAKRDSQPSFTDVAAVDVLGELGHASVIRFGAQGDCRRIIEDPRFAAAEIPIVLLDVSRESGLAVVPSLLAAGYSVSAEPFIWGWRHDGVRTVNGHAAG